MKDILLQTRPSPEKAKDEAKTADKKESEDIFSSEIWVHAESTEAS